MAYQRLWTPEAMILTPLVLLLLLAVACGAAATAVPADKPTAAPAPITAPKAAPTVAPQPTPAAAAASVVSPGKVTWMVAAFGNERFDYALASGAGNNYARHLHDFLISSDVKDGRRALVPGIAAKWEVSSDGLTWTFTIRKGVKFHDGKDATTEDVLWSLQHTYGPQAKDYAIGGDSLTASAIMDRIQQTGPDRISLTTKVPQSETLDLVSEATGGWSGIVFPKRATLHNVAEEEAYDRKPIGTGIMKLVKHVPAEMMSFERFADHYYQPKNGLPTDKRVNFTLLDMRLVPEEATRVAALRGGEADIAPVSLATRTQVEAGSGRLVFGQEGVYLYLRQYGCWKSEFPCHDKRVRQALAYAIDKELIRDRLYGGTEVMQVKGWFAVTPSTKGYSLELDPFPYDPAKARQLLADAGYPGGKGFGKLIINTWVSASLPLMPESAQLGAEFWRRELGLDAEVKVTEEAGFKKASRFTEEYFGQIAWRDNETRIDAVDILRSGYMTPTRNDRATTSDPELLALSQKAAAVIDPVEREKVLNSHWRRLRDEAYDIQIGYLNIPWGVGPRIRRWEPYPVAFYPSALHTITLK